jgi:hypothetical protein
MLSNAPGKRKAAPITSVDWLRLRQDAIRARTPGTAALAGSDCFLLSIIAALSRPHNNKLHRVDARAVHSTGAPTICREAGRTSRAVLGKDRAVVAARIPVENNLRAPRAGNSGAQVPGPIVGDALLCRQYEQLSLLTRVLGAGNSCTITVTFTPTAVGLQYGRVRIFDDARRSPQLVPLQGRGQSRWLGGQEDSTENAYK